MFEAKREETGAEYTPYRGVPVNSAPENFGDDSAYLGPQDTGSIYDWCFCAEDLPDPEEGGDPDCRHCYGKGYLSITNRLRIVRENLEARRLGWEK